MLFNVMTLLSGVAVLLTATSLMLWQILSAPDRPNYPTSGRFKRSMMFVLMVMLFGRGAELISIAFDPTSPGASPWQIASAFALCGLFVTFLVDHVQHWLPAKTHRNIQRLYRIARCSPRGLRAARASANRAAGRTPQGRVDMVPPALVELTLQGAKVAAPNEGPEAFTDA